MNFDDALDSLWRSPANQSADSLAAAKGAFAGRVRSDRRRFALVLLITGSILVLATGTLVAGLLDQPLTLASSTLCVLLVPPWIAFAFFLRGHSRHRPGFAATTDPDAPIGESLHSLLDLTRRAQTRVRTIALLHSVSLPILMLAVRQLRDTGRINGGELQSLALVLALLLGSTAVGLSVRYFSILRPRERALRSLLASYA